MIREETLIMATSIDGTPRLKQTRSIADWPSEHATKTFLSTVAEIIQLGFKGVIVEIHSQDNGLNTVLLQRTTASPEGRMIGQLLQLAEVGRSISTGEVIVDLERTYRKLGLTLPNRKAGDK